MTKDEARALFHKVLPCVVPADSDPPEDWKVRMDAQEAATQLYQAAIAAKPVRVFVIVEGGLIQNVLASDPAVVDVVEIDYDTDGMERNETTQVPQVRDGKFNGNALAAMSRWSSDSICEVEKLLAAKAVRMFGEGPS